jgi:hypothetical protein
MGATMDRVLDRVRKLLALKTSSNPHEAAVAAEMAARLLAEHRLSEAQVMIDIGATDDAPTVRERLDDGPRSATWRVSLCSAVARDNCCRILIGRGYYIVVGTTDDINATKYLYEYLRREVERLSDEAETPEGENGRAWKNSFKIGAAAEVSSRIYKAKREREETLKAAAGFVELSGGAPAQSTALAIVNKRDERAQAAVANVKGSWSRGGASRRDAYSAGRAAGASVSLGGRGRGIASAPRQIGGRS